MIQSLFEYEQQYGRCVPARRFLNWLTIQGRGLRKPFGISLNLSKISEKQPKQLSFASILEICKDIQANMAQHHPNVIKEFNRKKKTRSKYFTTTMPQRVRKRENSCLDKRFKIKSEVIKLNGSTIQKQYSLISYASDAISEKDIQVQRKHFHQYVDREVLLQMAAREVLKREGVRVPEILEDYHPTTKSPKKVGDIVIYSIRKITMKMAEGSAVSPKEKAADILRIHNLLKKHGIYHNDLKTTGNVFFDKTAKTFTVIDFGEGTYNTDSTTDQPKGDENVLATYARMI